MIETTLALVVGSAILAAGLSLGIRVRQEAYTSRVIAATQDVVVGLRAIFGTANQGYPANVNIAQTLRDQKQGPAIELRNDGCYVLDGTTELCLSVTDDGGGRGMAVRMEYNQKMGGSRAQTCRDLVDVLQRQSMFIEVGAAQPVDGSGQYLRDADWDGFWSSRCSSPLLITFGLR